MSLSSIAGWRERIHIDLYTLTLINVAFAAQLAVALAYGVYYDIVVTSLTHYLIPLIWITSGVWAILAAEPRVSKWSHRIIGILAGGSYFLLLLYLSGLLSPVTPQGQSVSSTTVDITLRVALGWGPAITYTGDYLQLMIIPFQVIGYAALAYLFYIAILDVTNAAFGGILGLAPCPGCAAPLLTSVFAGALGTSPVLVTLVSYTYEIATLLFLLALALLYWRPTLDELLN